MTIIDKLKNFVTLIESNGKVDKNQLEIVLTELYHSGLTATRDDESEDFGSSFDYNDLRQIISTKFPNYGFYNEPSDLVKLDETAELIIGDAIDDLTDIYKDIKESLSFEKDKHIVSHFKLNFDIHTKEHIINLLKYLDSTNK